MTSPSSEFFRCPVSPERGEAVVRIGRRRLPVEVHEASIDGFTILVHAAQACRLTFGSAWTLNYDGAVLEVHPQWFFNAPDGNVQVGLRRLRDLTPEPSFTGRWSGWRSRNVESTHGGPPLVLAGTILALIVGLTWTGIGGKLAATPVIGNLVQWVGGGLRQLVGPFI